MKVYYADHFAYPLPAGHRFPADKYGRLRMRVAAQLTPPCELHESPAATEAELLRVHTADYVQKVVTGGLDLKEVRRIGFPWSPQLVERCRRSVGGTLAAGWAALEEGYAVSLTGGTHHAFADHGEGFCVFNDCAVAARAWQREGRLRRVVLVDCDVHQGNGSAAIFAGDPSVFTFSIHGAKNFPFHKERSDLDVELPDGATDAIYCELLEAGLKQALAAARADLAVYIAGADPFAGDALGRLSVTKEGLRQRDQLVLAHCKAAGLPVAAVMGGGYAANIEDTVDIQFATVAALAVAAHPEYAPIGQI